MPDTRLYNIAQSLLDNLADGLADEGIPVPDRQYVHSGEVAYDLVGETCAEAFIVSFQGILQGAGDATGFIPGTPIKCAVPLLAQFDIVLLRCVPVLDDDGEPPTAAALTTAALDILYDSMTLPAVAISKELAGALTEQRCSLKGIGAVTPIGPSGGVGGCTLTLYVDLV